MRPRPRTLAACALAALLALLLALPARAHANLLRSTPAAGESLAAAPPAIVLEFSEALDANFSRMQLFDAQNRLIERGPGLVGGADGTELRLTVADLAQGSYTAIWRVRSAIDGHISEGSLPFGVGVPAPAGSLIPPAGAPDPATLPPPPLDMAARWLSYLAATLALGTIPFALLVWRPALRAWAAQPSAGEPPARSADAAMTAFLRRLLRLGGLAMLLSTLLFLLTQAASAADVPLRSAIGAPLLGLLTGPTGLVWLARLALIGQIIVMARRLPLAGSGPAGLWWALAINGGVALLTFSLLSHAAASPQAAQAVPIDWLHLAAMVSWVGGLPPLLYAASLARSMPGQAPPLAGLAARFTRVALVAVALLALSGLYSAWLQVGRPELLTATSYGRALLIKLGLFALLLAFGAVNLLLLTRRLRAGQSRAPQQFGRSLRAEIGLGALALLAVGAMTSVAPSLAAWQAHEQQGIAQSAQVGEVGLTLRVAPAQIGDNEFAVDVDDRRPGAAEANSKLLLRFDMQGMEMGNLQAEASTSDRVRYTARGSYTTMGGRWHIEVLLRRAGFDDVKHVFEVDILRGAPFVIE